LVSYQNILKKYAAKPADDYKEQKNSNNFYIIVVLYINKLAMRLNHLKINAL
jgi:hypothetical protein